MSRHRKFRKMSSASTFHKPSRADAKRPGEPERYETTRRTAEELDVSTIQEQSGAASKQPHTQKMDLKLEAVVIPVSDVQIRVRAFYSHGE